MRTGKATNGDEKKQKDDYTMTFKQFEKVVKEHLPGVEVFPHGNFTNRTTLSVAVIFNNGNSKTYLYTGTYAQVLNRLGIKTATKCDVWNMQMTLQRLKETHGTEGLFGDIIDNAESITEIEKELADINKHYVVV